MVFLHLQTRVTRFKVALKTLQNQSVFTKTYLILKAEQPHLAKPHRGIKRDYATFSILCPFTLFLHISRRIINRDKLLAGGVTFCWNLPIFSGKKLDINPGGGVLNFGLCRDVRLEALNMGSCRADQRQIWGLVELIV